METFFLAIFVFGALFTLASALLGATASVDHGFGHGHVGHGGHGGHAALQHGGLASSLRGAMQPLLNGSTVLAFLTWFGAAGYLLTRLSEWALPAVLLGALIGGGIGGYLVARFLGLLLSGERVMDPARLSPGRHARPDQRQHPGGRNGRSGVLEGRRAAQRGRAGVGGVANPSGHGGGHYAVRGRLRDRPAVGGVSRRARELGRRSSEATYMDISSRVRRGVARWSRCC